MMRRAANDSEKGQAMRNKKFIKFTFGDGNAMKHKHTQRENAHLSTILYISRQHNIGLLPFSNLS